MIQDIIKQRLAFLEPSHISLKGHTGNTGGGHFDLEITSSHFLGKSTIMRHRLVYDALKDLIPEKIHALSIKADLP